MGQNLNKQKVEFVSSFINDASLASKEVFKLNIASSPLKIMKEIEENFDNYQKFILKWMRNSANTKKNNFKILL